MTHWEIYTNLINQDGENQRLRTINRTKKEFLKKSKNSPAYKEVLIDGKKQNVLIISSSTELDIKKIVSMPNEIIGIGSIVEWNNEHWIVYDNDCEDSIYQVGRMYRCNVYLKWQNEDGQIIGRYGYIEDTSKAGVGLKTSGSIMYQLQQYYKGYFALDSETIKIRRDKRFLMDVDNLMPDAYIVTNRKVMNYNFNASNIDENYQLNTKDHLIIFMFTQTQRNDERDNFELMIADYIQPSLDNIDIPIPNDTHIDILYDGNPTIKCGGSYKEFKAQLVDDKDNIINQELVWNLITLDNQEKYFEYLIESNSIKIKAIFDENLIDSQIKLVVSTKDNIYKNELYIKVVSLYG